MNAAPDAPPQQRRPRAAAARGARAGAGSSPAFASTRRRALPSASGGVAPASTCRQGDASSSRSVKRTRGTRRVDRSMVPRVRTPSLLGASFVGALGGRARRRRCSLACGSAAAATRAPAARPTRGADRRLPRADPSRSVVPRHHRDAPTCSPAHPRARGHGGHLQLESAVERPALPGLGELPGVHGRRSTTATSCTASSTAPSRCSTSVNRPRRGCADTISRAPQDPRLAAHRSHVRPVDPRARRSSRRSRSSTCRSPPSRGASRTRPSASTCRRSRSSRRTTTRGARRTSALRAATF